MKMEVMLEIKWDKVTKILTKKSNKKEFGLLDIKTFLKLKLSFNKKNQKKIMYKST